ncbi:lysosomal cholesterol signaling protein-like [Dermacentor albipictus]|uniref:lysosomal cholesterol signaling protein-like n=1 Tax=Dermacentor albipictus TaxID=60249 RepID=UPI0038FBF4FB
MWDASEVVAPTATQGPVPCLPRVDNVAFSWTLVKCFTIVLLGFASGKARLVKGREVRALDLLASHVCLSALLFVNLSQLRLHTFEWRLVAAVLLGKAALFALVAAASAALPRSSSSRRGGGQLATAGLHAIFVTQVNDFGIAYPLVESVFGRSHPEFAGYLYLVAPLSLVLFNPIGFFLAELQGLRSQRRYTDDAIETTPQKQSVARRLFKAAAWAVFKVLYHPHVLSSLLAIAVNIGRSGEQLPAPLAAILKLLGDAFAAPVLFLLGYHIEKAFQEPDVREHLLPAFILSAVKSFALPMFLKVSVELVLYWSGAQAGVKDRANFAFLYGSAPTAPIVILYASQRALPAGTLATGVGVCTLLSLPVMFATAAVISDEGLPAAGVSPHLQMRTALACLGGLSLLASVFVIGLFMLTRRTKGLICNVLLCLLICEAFKSAGVLLWLLHRPHSQWGYVAVFLVTCSQYASRAWTASLALSVFLLKYYNSPELTTHVRIMFFVAYGVPVILTAAVMIGGRFLCRRQISAEVEVPLFFNGECEAVASVVLLSVCAALIALCLLQHAHERTLKTSFFECCCCCRSRKGFGAGLENQCYEKAPPARKYDETLDERSLLGTTTRVRFNLPPSGHESWPGKDDGASAKAFEPEDDVRGLTLLIAVLFISIFIGIFVSYGRLFLGVPYGIFRVLQLVDATLSLGQGMLVLLTCGLEGKLLSEAKARALLLLRIAGKRRHPKERTVPAGLRNANEIACRQFNVYHRRAFEEFLDETEAGVPMSLARSGFHGHRLVDWLLDAGLVRSRDEGVVYGRRLLEGGLLVHTERGMHFYDGPYDYIFVF